MRTVIIYLSVVYLFVGCTAKTGHQAEEDHHEHPTEVVLNEAQMQHLKLETGPLENKALAVHMETNGVLEAPPNSEAVVTSLMAAKITSIKVMEGQEVKKGQVLATLAEPALTELQSKYLEAFYDASYAEKEYLRQKKLFESEVGAGKTYQQVESEYNSAKAVMKSLQQQLLQLGMNPAYIEKGNLYKEIVAVSPISGTVGNIYVKTGQYVQPEKELFEIISTENLYARLQVFEKDIDKVAVGQEIKFKVFTYPNLELKGKVYAIGKRFEENSNAINIYASIRQKGGNLISGMYVKGEILKEGATTPALPVDAVVTDGEKKVVFTAHQQNGSWVFKPVEVIVSGTDDGWLAVSLKEAPGANTVFALNNAYYLLAEMKKGELEH